MTKAKAAKKKDKLVKAPNAPRRFKSAYMFFSTWKHKEIRKSLGKDQNLSTPEVAKMVSKAWKDMSSDERAPWDLMAMKDRLRFESEKNSYQGPWKIQDVGDMYDKEVRRPTSAFLLFSNAHREEVKKTNPGLSTTSLSAILSRMWKKASAEEKEMYNENYRVAYENYKKEKETYKRDNIGKAVAQANAKEKGEGSGQRLIPSGNKQEGKARKYSSTMEMKKMAIDAVIASDNTKAGKAKGRSKIRSAGIRIPLNSTSGQEAGPPKLQTNIASARSQYERNQDAFNHHQLRLEQTRRLLAFEQGHAGLLPAYLPASQLTLLPVQHASQFLAAARHPDPVIAYLEAGGSPQPGGGLYLPPSALMYLRAANGPPMLHPAALAYPPPSGRLGGQAPIPSAEDLVYLYGYPTAGRKHPAPF